MQNPKTLRLGLGGLFSVSNIACLHFDGCSIYVVTPGGGDKPEEWPIWGWNTTVSSPLSPHEKVTSKPVEGKSKGGTRRLGPREGEKAPRTIPHPRGNESANLGGKPRVLSPSVLAC